MSGDLGNQIGASGRDALGAITTLALNPVGGLAPAFEALGPARALSAGLALCAAFAIVATIGVSLGASRAFAMLGLWMDSGPGFTFYLKAFVAFLVLPAAFIGVSLGLRKVLGGKAPLAADAFTTGAALTPLAVAIVLTALLGAANLEIATVLILFALSYLILILYAGLTRLGGVSERAAAPAVPVLLILAGWVCKVIFGAMM